MSAEQLKQMFPSFDLSVLQSVLEECGNDMTKATDALLAMSTDAPAPGIAAAKMPIQPARRVDLSEIIRRVCSMPDEYALPPSTDAFFFFLNHKRILRLLLLVQKLWQ
jgi:hypothetical protein